MNNNNNNDNNEMKLKCALHMIIDPRLKRKPSTPRPNVGFYGVFDTSLDLNMFSFLSLFYAGDDLSIYIMT